MAKNYFNRYVWLIDTIQKHGHITFEELSDAWQRSALNEDGSYLPERTFFNHREAIKDIFGIEFKFDKSLGYSLVCDDLNADGIREWLLTSLSVNNMIKESSELRHRILFENIPSGREYLHAIIDAMKDNEILEISYKRFTDAQAACFEIAPYCVKLYKQRWYVVCKPCGDRNISIYSLDRIQNLRKTGRFFKMPVKFDAAEYFAQYFGIVHDESYPVGTIRLKVTASQRHYFRTLPLQFQPAGDSNQ